MARVSIFQGGNVNTPGLTEARVKAADFGTPGLAVGLQKAGEGLEDFAQKQDEIEDIKAKIEANRLAVEHNEAIRERARQAREVLGEGAEAAAEQAVGDIDGLSSEVLGRASPRARMLLEPHVQRGASVARENLYDHGFGEKVKVFDTGALARINSITEAAQDEDDSLRAGLLLAPIRQINQERAQFYGKPQQWAEEETAKMVSGFHKSRALKLAQDIGGRPGSARAAISYAESARRFMNDDDFNAVLTGYGDNAIDEAALEREGYAQTGDAVSDTGGPAFSPPAVKVGTDPATGEAVKRLDPGTFFDGWIVPQEGSKYVVDNNGYGVKYGFNEKSWPGLDVKNLTYARAKELFTKEIFNAMNGQNLPPALAAMVVDTRMLAGPGRANQMLRESGGDIEKYAQLRRNFLNGLAAKDPKKYPGPAWERRTSQLMDYADRLGAGGGSVRATFTPGQPGGTAAERIAAIKSDTSMSVRLRQRMVAAIERGEAETRQQKAQQESDAADALVEAELALGDKFTDVKQLPQDVWLRASPQARAMMTARAKSNVESRPLTPELAQMIAHTKISNPRLFMSPGFQQQLAAAGAPTSAIRAVAAEAGAMQATIQTGRTDPTRLWSIAAPALEGAGINFDTIETKPPEGATKAQKQEFARQAQIERRQDALRKTRLLDDLSSAEARWRQNNPGKEPTDADLRQMVGNALTRFGPGSGQGGGRPFFNMTADEIMQQIPKGDRDDIISALRAENIRVTPTAIANMYRQRFISGDWQWRRRQPAIAPLPSGPAPGALTGGR